MEVTVWSDVGCPWASLALHALHCEAGRRGEELEVDHRAFPLELLNSVPTPKPGHDAEVAAIGAVRPDLGWSPWAAPDSTYPVTTLPAMEAVQAARRDEVGGLAASTELDLALRHAFFGEHRCISVHSVIEDVARKCDRVDADELMRLLAQGVGRREVYADLRAVQAGEAEGSPHVFTPAGPVGVNPGVEMRPVGGFPRIEAYDPDWAARLWEARSVEE